MTPSIVPQHGSVAGIILAAGEGRRLRPLSASLPKCLVPFQGVAMLELAAARLSTLPLAATAVNTCYLAEQVAAAVTELNHRHGYNLRLSRETSCLDTGGGIRQAIRQLPASTEHFLVHNADIVLDADLQTLLRIHLDSQADATLLLIPGKGVRTVDCHPDGRISCFRRSRGTGQATFSGVHVLHRRVLDFLPDTPVCSIITAYERALQAGRRIQGVSLPAVFWADIGTIAALIQAHADIDAWPVQHHNRLQAAVATQQARRRQLCRQGVRCTGAISLPANLQVAPGSQLHNVIINTTHPLPMAIYAQAIMTEVPLAAAATAASAPDPRIWQALEVDPAAADLIPLRQQASGRRYGRIRAGEHSWVWCAYDRARAENGAFATLAHWLAANGLAVPEVHLHLADSCQLLLQDLGDCTLQQSPAGPAELQRWLDMAVAQAAHLHALDSQLASTQLPLQPAFTTELYHWEHAYFRQHCLAARLQAEQLWTAAVQAEATSLVQELLAQPPVLVHRDLQSANLMIWQDQVWLLDFQGMRLGCAAYDLASLLYDPYLRHSPQRRQQLWQCYQHWSAHYGGAPCSQTLLAKAAVQRLLQALGAFTKLAGQDRLPWYAAYILPALEHLQAAASAAGLAAIARLASAASSRYRG